MKRKKHVRSVEFMKTGGIVTQQSGDIKWQTKVAAG